MGPEADLLDKSHGRLARLRLRGALSLKCVSASVIIPFKMVHRNFAPFKHAPDKSAFVRFASLKSTWERSQRDKFKGVYSS